MTLILNPTIIRKKGVCTLASKLVFNAYFGFYEVKLCFKIHNNFLDHMGCITLYIYGPLFAKSMRTNQINRPQQQGYRIRYMRAAEIVGAIDARIFT